MFRYILLTLSNKNIENPNFNSNTKIMAEISIWYGFEASTKIDISKASETTIYIYLMTYCLIEDQ